ncbi:hypothetical protein IFM89_037845 [Coptis chinensis]|uniref:Uncharacterized protein n=1 Tax=Coptis chinensis TaxID=261450 RepID=A0A835LUF6_9MAGN|nr:hypothetical protein IFM89_037845 [Coptis chinensis]
MFQSGWQTYNAGLRSKNAISLSSPRKKTRCCLQQQQFPDEVSGIQVPRQKYISVSKSDILTAILSSSIMFQDSNFTRFASCLDSVIHAEHKAILEEMRKDYPFSHSKPTKNSDNFNFNLTSFLSSPAPKDTSNTSASRFQRAFLNLLQDAQFEELSVRDLSLTSALNTDYLLTLPIYVDWKRAYESNAIIFRRGYATERQKGLLIVEKLDYLQSKLLQGVFFSLSKPLGKIGMLIKQAFESDSKTQELQVWMGRITLWLKESSLQQSYSDGETTFEDQLVSDELSVSDLPIWLAAQRAVPRYEGLLSSVGPRGRLLRKLLTWTGLVPSSPKASLALDRDDTTSEHYLRPSFLSRISLSDIWKPATRDHCGNDILKMLKTAVSIFFSQSTLQEPAFQELILLYNEENGQRETDDEAEIPSLKLKIYERIPIPDLPVVFPHKKLSFRILDTVRLDVASILGLLAFFLNYKFEDIRSSPSAILLDIIAVTAFVIYLSRLVLGYKQTRDRYQVSKSPHPIHIFQGPLLQLLVNRTLYEKTLASGFGSVHFLLDASEQQQYKEAILAYAVLLRAEEGQVTCQKFVGDTCEKFIYKNFKEKVEMPVNNAINTLLRLGLVTEVATDGITRLHALPCSEGYEALKRYWDLLLR